MYKHISIQPFLQKDPSALIDDIHGNTVLCSIDKEFVATRNVLPVYYRQVCRPTYNYISAMEM